MRIGAEMSSAMAALDRQVASAKSVASQAIVRDKLDKTQGADSVTDATQDAVNVGAANAGDAVKEADAAVAGEEAAVDEAEGPLGNNLDVTA